MDEVKKSEKRPVLKLHFTQWEKTLEAVSIFGLLLLLLLTFQSWEDIPESVPQHFNISGEVDIWGRKELLIFLPIGAVLLYAALSIIRKYPHRFNYPWKITEANARAQYQIARHLLAWLKAETIWSFLYLQWMMIQIALGRAEGLNKAFLPMFLLVIFGTLGVYLVKLVRNK